jgi:hypothetical protein
MKKFSYELKPNQFSIKATIFSRSDNAFGETIENIKIFPKAVDMATEWCEKEINLFKEAQEKGISKHNLEILKSIL